MKKSSKLKDVYKVNDRVTVTVDNVPAENDDGSITFQRKVTIKINEGWNNEKLQFNNDGDFQRYIEELDLEDDQVDMFGGQV